MNDDIVLKNFGNRELSMLSDLLTAYLGYKTNRTSIFDNNSDIHIGFNANSGYVYLYDDEYNVAIVVDGALYDFITCSECGNEWIDKVDNIPESECCKNYYKEVIQND